MTCTSIPLLLFSISLGWAPSARAGAEFKGNGLMKSAHGPLIRDHAPEDKLEDLSGGGVILENIQSLQDRLPTLRGAAEIRGREELASLRGELLGQLLSDYEMYIAWLWQGAKGSSRDDYYTDLLQQRRSAILAVIASELPAQRALLRWEVYDSLPRAQRSKGRVSRPQISPEDFTYGLLFCNGVEERYPVVLPASQERRVAWFEALEERMKKGASSAAECGAELDNGRKP